MRKMLFVLLLSLMLSVSGCIDTPAKNEVSDPNLPPIESQIKTEPDDWIAAYGDTDKTQIYYNIALTQWALNQHSEIINRQAAIIKQLAADVNELKSPVKKRGLWK